MSNLFDHFFEWDCWFCNHCDQGVANNRRDMLRHLLNVHDIEVADG